LERRHRRPAASDDKEMSEDARLADFFHVQMDVADSQSVDAGVDAVIKRFGG
jgi:hypothetical protein